MSNKKKKYTRLKLWFKVPIFNELDSRNNFFKTKFSQTKMKMLFIGFFFQKTLTLYAQ